MEEHILSISAETHETMKQQGLLGPGSNLHRCLMLP